MNMNRFTKFAVAVFAVTLGLTGCAQFIPKPYSAFEEQVPEEITQIRVLLAKNTNAVEWYVERGTHYNADNFPGVLAERIKSGERTMNFTRHFPELPNPAPATVAIANLVVSGVKKDLGENGLKVVSAPCDSCFTIKVDLAHYEGEVTKFLAFIPIQQKATYLFHRARIFYQGKLILQTDERFIAEGLKGLVESNTSHEERTATVAAHLASKSLLAVIAETRQQLLATASQ